MANQAGRGGFKKGKSGNLGGRPRQLKSVMHEASQHKFEAIRTLHRIRRGVWADRTDRRAAEKSRSLSRSGRNLGLCLKNSGQNQLLRHGEI